MENFILKHPGKIPGSAAVIAAFSSGVILLNGGVGHTSASGEGWYLQGRFSQGSYRIDLVSRVNGRNPVRCSEEQPLINAVFDEGLRQLTIGLDGIKIGSRRFVRTLDPNEVCR